MEYRLWQEKLLLVKSIKEKEENSLARRVLEQQVAMGWLGLATEAAYICRKIGLRNVCIETVSKEDIKDNIWRP